MGRFSPGRIVVNLAHLPKKDTATFAQALDDLLIHECAHRFSSDHLSMTYINACTSLGAKLRTLGAVRASFSHTCRSRVLRRRVAW